MVSSHIVEEEWPVLVAYWKSKEVQEIARRNAANRDLHGPVHHTGRKHFAQLRHEMQTSGEYTCKMAVWKKSRKESDPEVKQIIEYDRRLARESEDRRNLVAVKDKIFHDLLGEDGHGYCCTYGSSVPRSLVYSQEPVPPESTTDMIQTIREKVTQTITEQVTAKVKADLEKSMKEFIVKLNAKIHDLENNGGHGGSNVQHGHLVPADARSGHEPRRESIGDQGELPNTQQDSAHQGSAHQGSAHNQEQEARSS